MKGIIGAVLGLAIGLFIFKISEEIVKYKCRKLNKEIPGPDTMSAMSGNIFILIHVLLYTTAYLIMPPAKAIFVGLFITIAMIGTIVDIYIHIIPNETVLFLLGTGVVYRIITEGMSSFKGSLLGLLLITGLFLGTGAIVYLMKGTIGVGAGDLKLAMAIALTLGYPGALYFLFGLAGAILGYLALRYKSKTLIFGASFPMAGQIMTGFIVAFFFPYVF
ncbi:MAG TPA: prepilin peptidase [Clostridia bacterium]|nr:prepilin peptidase [Clostridia bacterium]